MKHLAPIPLVIAAMTLGACGNSQATGNMDRDGPANGVIVGGSGSPGQTAPEQAFGPEEAMAGTFVTRFEHDEFNGCWLDMTAEAAADFRRFYPPDSADAPQHGRSYRLRIMGRHSIDSSSGPPSYGHMGGWRCEIRATRILSAEVVGAQAAPPAGKGDTAISHGLGAGHDRARLEDQRRQMGQ